MAKSVWTDAQIISQMDSGLHWSGSNITYGFPTTANWFPYGEKDRLFAAGRHAAGGATRRSRCGTT